jgi:alkylhydroperoxidase family enzyme
MSTTYAIQPRMKNPAMVIPGAMQAIQALSAATRQTDVPDVTLELVHLRASQINGCSACVDGGAKQDRKSVV